ncbi:MAG TPA: fibronectin type III domain-containing protein, partial [Verrucomicrobiae bacterium]|nr:fibronectin type III domain-containing protein [Verrucomicrobiae bacterium]
NQLDAIYAVQKYNQFGPARTAILFKPGQYNNLNLALGYYTQALGLGRSPDDVTFVGYFHSDGVLVNENATVNFWRSAENFSVIPTNSANYAIWAVSQGTALRRMHIQGTLDLANFTDGNFASGGFMADSKVDGTVSSLSQQQWLSRNDVWGSWSGGVWNMVFVGVTNPPAGTWPTKVYTVITNTPIIREKPYLYLDTNGAYAVMVPALQTNSTGITWANGPTPGTSIPISRFYIAHADSDTAASINNALNAGLNLVLCPGVYQLASSLQVTNPDTIILGLGYPTLIPQNGTPALTVADVDGVKIGGLLFDAGPVQSQTLLQVGITNSTANHSGDPIFIYDISMRVGGAAAGSTLSCMQINANDTVADNVWLWRADHGAGVGWTQNVSDIGLLVNGNRVTIYGLFVEHHQQYETLWNGNWGRLYFYQSELPYDPPSQALWSHNGVNGYASYKVADSVTSHQAYGLGIYAVFINCVNISCDNAIETPTNAPQVNLHDMITVYIDGDVSGGGTSSLFHVINGTGATLSGPGFGGTAKVTSLSVNPTFSLSTATASASSAGGFSLSFPTESAHTYQVQYKNSLMDANWSNLGSPFAGNDAQQPVNDPTPMPGRFYRIVAY